jgi:acyl-CoA synthetase (AMP-forming)/AMP-acid ligase II
MMDAIWAFRRSASRGPHRTFAFDGAEAVSYADADHRSDAAAATFASLGLASGDAVGLCSPDSVTQLIAILGLWKAGLQPSLIDPRTPTVRLPYFVDDIGAKHIFTTPEHRKDLVAAGAASVLNIETLSDGSVPSIACRHGPEAPLYLSYTSGTTGSPKGALLRSGPVTVGTACIAERLGLAQDDVVLVATPTASSFQLVAALLPAIHVGATVVLAAGRSPGEICELGISREITVLVAYPLTLAEVVNADGAKPSTLRFGLSGGSPLAPRVKRDYQDQLGIPLLESYGQSELGGFMALGGLHDRGDTLDGFVGRPLPDRPAYVADADGRELHAGEIGEVVVPFGYFVGYVNKPRETGISLAGGLLRCGDLAISDEDRRIRVLGRTTERERAAGRGGFVRDLEDALYEDAEVLHAAAVEDSSGDLQAYVEPLPGRVVRADNLGASTSHLVPGLRPRNITILDRMPRTFSGKVDRLALSKRSAP